MLYFHSAPSCFSKRIRKTHQMKLGGGGLGSGGWAIRVRGMGYHAPTPQAGRVTDSDRAGRVRDGGEVVPCPHAT